MNGMSGVVEAIDKSLQQISLGPFLNALSQLVLLLENGMIYIPLY